jgi:hypothetical protein
VDDAQRRPLPPGKIICLRELQLFTVNDTKVSKEAALRAVHGLESRGFELHGHPLAMFSGIMGMEAHARCSAPSAGETPAPRRSA